jgi:hypothetical protein
MKKSFSLPGCFLIPVLCVTGFVRCKSSSSVLPPRSDTSCFYNGVDTCNLKDGKLVLQVDPAVTYQTIHSFGASDGWTTKFIGNWADVRKKNHIADLLFSMDTAQDGTPVGIGLSLWRFNIGAGSYEQGDSSDIATDWRREECFLNADGTYDWSKEAGHQWFLQAARQRGVRYTLGFALSPPVSMTANGKASAMDAKGIHLNIRDGMLGDYAAFLEKVADHFHFDYITPVNEPQWAWGGDGSTISTQEGSQATNGDIASLVRLLSGKLQDAGSSARVVVGEAGTWNFLFGNNTDGRGDQIRAFFSPASPDYIGDLPHVAHAISAHSYYTTCPDNTLVDTRQQVASGIAQVEPGLQTWMTEFGILGNICDTYSGSPRSTGINYGLYVAKVIHNDLAVAHVSSWQWWLAINPYNYSDGLVYINDPSGKIDVDNCRNDGIVAASSQLWALGNYSRFIRPGMQEIAATIKGISPVNAASSLMVSAFKGAADKTIVIVLVNMTGETKTISLTQGSSFALATGFLNAYTTDFSGGLKRSFEPADHIVAGPRSIITLTGKYK